MSERVRADKFECDSCGRVILVEVHSSSAKIDIGEVYGLHGSVCVISSGGGSANVDWFVCETCSSDRTNIGKALSHALENRGY